MKFKYCHVCIGCRDWKRISQFYQEVFGCIPIGEIRDMRGKWVGQLIAAENEKEAEIVGEHLLVPGYGEEGPTLELLSYRPIGKNIELECYDMGFSHICFEVPERDISAALERLVQYGGRIVSTFENPHGERVAYCRDPEGNIVEIRRPNDVKDRIRKRTDE